MFAKTSQNTTENKRSKHILKIDGNFREQVCIKTIDQSFKNAHSKRNRINEVVEK